MPPLCCRRAARLSILFVFDFSRSVSTRGSDKTRSVLCASFRRWDEKFREINFSRDVGAFGTVTVRCRRQRLNEYAW